MQAAPKALAAPAPAAVGHETPSPLQTPRRVLRFLTAGSVDDGKSTLIGRLLYDSRAILADQLDHLQARAHSTHSAPRAAGGPGFDLSLLTDGLEDEREQGITIDVAYRYFTTPTRKFIIADAPGHEQYTRNMVTAAAGSDAAVVLVDITKLDLPDLGNNPCDPANAAAANQPVPLLPQTRRHALLAHLLRVPSIVFAVNKIDAVANPGQAFEAVQRSLRAFAEQAGIAVAAVVPVSALRGDNVTQTLQAAWYRGPSLLQVLEQLPTTQEAPEGPFSLPVQYVARQGSGTGTQPRVLWGRVAQGRVRVGDRVQVFPSGEEAVVTEVRRASHQPGHAQAGESAGVVLDRQLDVSRGNWLAQPGSLQGTRHLKATLAWLDTEPAVAGRKYLLRHGNQWVQARLVSVDQKLDIHNLQGQAAQQLQVNDIGQVQFELQQALPLAPFSSNRMGGSLIVVDPSTHRTSAAVLVQDSR